ncbi:FAD-dependent oxidoreductase [Streptomyces melanogenes]|uniref:FAD-dependent oxidoreductase n=1 Tax=Streptomyces melanogenes TaxID=67326 RepID=UPI00379877D4
MATETTTCCIVGGGPAGAMLGLLLARAGIEVTVLEKHRDFLRDFRGDTIHPSTLDVLAELGLAERFLELPHRTTPGINMVTDTQDVLVADQRLLSGTYPYIAFVPQWDFLNLLAAEAATYPNFHLRMGAEVHGLIREGDRARGVRYRDAEGEHELRAELTVAADGRDSVLRRPAGLVPQGFGAPMDDLWFRIPREESDPPDTFIRMGQQGLLIGICRDTYWQFAYVIPKGRYAELQAEGIESLRSSVRALLPWMGDRPDKIEFSDARMLEVRVERLKRWYRPGLLFIGDAAHAMSPVGGFGINVAVQDAVATANLLAEPLRRGTVSTEDLAAVQRRRLPPAVAIQRMQILLQNQLIAPTLHGTRESKPPRFLAVAEHVRPMRKLIARMIGYGPRPEHVRTPERV